MKKNAPGPVIYLDPKTGQPVCDSVKCKDKFNTRKYDVKETNYKWSGGPVTHKFYYSLCDECGRQNITNKDKALTGQSFRRGTLNKGVDPEIEVNDGKEN